MQKIIVDNKLQNIINQLNELSSFEIEDLYDYMVDNFNIESKKEKEELQRERDKLEGECKDLQSEKDDLEDDIQKFKMYFKLNRGDIIKVKHINNGKHGTYDAEIINKEANKGAVLNVYIYGIEEYHRIHLDDIS